MKIDLDQYLNLEGVENADELRETIKKAVNSEKLNEDLLKHSSSQYEKGAKSASKKVPKIEEDEVIDNKVNKKAKEDKKEENEEFKSLKAEFEALKKERAEEKAENLRAKFKSEAKKMNVDDKLIELMIKKTPAEDLDVEDLKVFSKVNLGNLGKNKETEEETKIKNAQKEKSKQIADLFLKKGNKK